MIKNTIIIILILLVLYLYYQQTKQKKKEEELNQREHELTEWKDKQQKKLDDIKKKIWKIGKLFHSEVKLTNLDDFIGLLNELPNHWKEKLEKFKTPNVRSVYASPFGNEKDKRYFCKKCEGIDWENCPNCKND